MNTHRLINGNSISITLAITLLSLLLGGYTFINNTYATKDSVKSISEDVKEMRGQVFFIATRMGYKQENN